MQGKNRYILTVLGRKLSARQISAATSILAEQGMNIDAIKRLTGRIPWTNVRLIHAPGLHRIFSKRYSERPHCDAGEADEAGQRTGNGLFFPTG